MSRHNIVGSEALLSRGWEAREAAFSPAHGSLHMLPRRNRRLLMLLAIFAAGALSAIAAVALLAKP